MRAVNPTRPYGLARRVLTQRAEPLTGSRYPRFIAAAPLLNRQGARLTVGQLQPLNGDVKVEERARQQRA